MSFNTLFLIVSMGICVVHTHVIHPFESSKHHPLENNGHSDVSNKFLSKLDVWLSGWEGIGAKYGEPHVAVNVNGVHIVPVTTDKKIIDNHHQPHRHEEWISWEHADHGPARHGKDFSSVNSAASSNKSLVKKATDQPIISQPVNNTISENKIEANALSKNITLPVHSLAAANLDSHTAGHHIIANEIQHGAHHHNMKPLSVSPSSSGPAPGPKGPDPVSRAGPLKDRDWQPWEDTDGLHYNDPRPFPDSIISFGH